MKKRRLTLRRRDPRNPTHRRAPVQAMSMTPANAVPLLALSPAAAASPGNCSAEVAYADPAPTEAAVGLLKPTATYDDGLLDRCRQHWRLGEWAQLIDLPIDDVEQHPQRHRLFLMIGSAHFALGQFGRARQMLQQARQWGADEGLLQRVLLAGVHNTLGRATVAGGKHRDQALAHFRAALAPAGSGQTFRAALQGRIRQELSEMQLAPQAERWMIGDDSLKALPLGQGAQALRAPDKGSDKAAEKVTEKIVETQLAKLSKTLEGTLQRELANAVKQLEAYTNLQGYLSSGELMPALHGWPVSPDFALLLVQLLEQESYDAIVEFGSGSSTLLMARTLKQLASKRATQAQPIQLAFEHLEKYHQATAELLAGAGLRDAVTLVHAPLEPRQVADGDSFQYYRCDAALTELAHRLQDCPLPRILAIVDGPPEATGPMARYPALEVLLDALPIQQGHLLLDDYRRPGEQESARRWQALLKGRGIEPQVTEYPLEKMACLIRFDSSRATDRGNVPLITA